MEGAHGSKTSRAGERWHARDSAYADEVFDRAEGFVERSDPANDALSLEKDEPSVIEVQPTARAERDFASVDEICRLRWRWGDLVLLDPAGDALPKPSEIGR